MLQVERQVLDIREADLLEAAGATAAVLEVHISQRFGRDLLQPRVAGAGLLGLEEAGGVLRGQGDGEVRGTLSTDGKAGPLSVSASGRLGTFNNRLTLVLNARPGFGINDYQELVFTTVTPEQLVGSGTSTMQWGPAGPIDLKREAR